MRQSRADGNLRLVRAGREAADQIAARGCAARQVHAGVVGQVRFEDGGPTDARQLHQERQRQQPVGRNFIDTPPFVAVLVRGGEARQRQHRGDCTCRECKLRQLVGQFQIRPAVVVWETDTAARRRRHTPAPPAAIPVASLRARAA